MPTHQLKNENNLERDSVIWGHPFKWISRVTLIQKYTSSWTQDKQLNRYILWCNKPNTHEITNLQILDNSTNIGPDEWKLIQQYTYMYYNANYHPLPSAV